MAINSSGVWCDFCGDSVSASAFLAEVFEQPDVTYIEVDIAGFDRRLQCCQKCEPVLRKAAVGGDWSALPDGPVKEKFDKASKELEARKELANE